MGMTIDQSGRDPPAVAVDALRCVEGGGPRGRACIDDPSVSGGNDAGTRSDGYTKPLFIAGAGQWRAMAQRLGLKEVMLIDGQRNVSVTPAMQARLEATRNPEKANRNQ